MEKRRDLLERTLRFAVDALQLAQTLPKNTAGEILGRQLIKSATSVGANYREAQKARSPADFISKITITEEEAAESHYWLQLLSEARITDDPRLPTLIQEANELTAIFTASGKTAKSRHGRK